MIAIINADAFFASDAYSAMRMLKKIQIKAEVLFADAGFDCEEVSRGMFQAGYKANNKQIK
ncbi:MAG: hypothetical protein H5T45_00245 [Thermoplasmatales archaeon]|nr:hypothetical protein [Thermoplasmatales archaeon]